MARWTVLARCFVMAAACLALGACSTYVNIPAQPGDVARNDPNDTTVREVTATALEAVVADKPMGQFAVVLPPGTQPSNYDWIVTRVSPAAMWSAEPLPANIPIFEVRQVRVRGWNAQVDVIRPVSQDDPGRLELITAYLKSYPVGGWAVQNLRVWRGSLENALRESAQLETGVAP